MTSPAALLAKARTPAQAAQAAAPAEGLGRLQRARPKKGQKIREILYKSIFGPISVFVFFSLYLSDLLVCVGFGSILRS